MSLLFFVAMLCVASICLIGVLSCAFQDTLPQRIGMAITAIGAIAAGINRGENAFICMGYGVAIYCIATAYKIWRLKHGNP